ncbi:PREDICTED: uncharacterized protein LOC108579686 [Habropoda laboriosa]|nr:PREDICTED: uncharacterized protein LOC108579686 [Habropoda laboriosa]
MRSTLLLFLSLMASSSAAPYPQDTLFPLDKDEPRVSTETEIVTVKDATNHRTKNQSEKTDSGTKDSRTSLLSSSILNDRDNRTESDTGDPQRNLQSHESSNNKLSKKHRKQKAILYNYPLVQQQLPFSNLPYDVDYPSDNFDTEERTTIGDSNSFQESNIFYIRLPPTPYMFVPGLGYISQPPTYSTSSLRPQIPFVRPARPKPTYQQQQQQPVNPFIKLPIDFVSNGKPTSVYQWQKKTNKKPTDSPITNLDSLSAEFVSNGKPTSIYQWQSNLKPINKNDDLVNNLDKGPYTFNGKPTSFFLLKADGTSTAHQPLRYPDYQQDNSYY